jgi:hypothetical protein
MENSRISNRRKGRKRRLEMRIPAPFFFLRYLRFLLFNSIQPQMNWIHADGQEFGAGWIG